MARPTPLKPDKALVRMGIYLFDTKALVTRRSALPITSFDFGKDVIPEMIRSHRVNAYNHTMSGSGLGVYWRDVGALDTYYRSQMDLLSRESPLTPITVRIGRFTQRHVA